MRKKLMWLLLIVAYAVITMFGFLSGMFSESLIDSVHPWADMLADVIVWFGVTVALSPAVCLLTANFLREKPDIRRMSLAMPFVLLALQLVLSHMADML